MTVREIEPVPPALSLTAVFLRFLRFGLLAFGGPVAQIAMIRRELVDQGRWMSSARFNRLLAVLQILPGPEAHELCVHMGMRARGRMGGLLAGLGFMLPGLILMLGIGWAYVALSPVVGLLAGAFLGVQAAVVAVIVRAVCKIGSHILEDRWLWAVAVVGFAATMAGAAFWIVLAAGGAAYLLVRVGRVGLAVGVVALAVLAALAMHGLGNGGPVFGQTAGPAGDGGWVAMFWTGLKAGLLTFGGAYTAIPYVQADTVGRGWISGPAFLDGVAFAGVLPAPLVIFSTFAGYLAGGVPGALVITAGMFLPAFAFSLVLYERLEALVEAPTLHDTLTGVAAAVVGVIAGVWLRMAWTTGAAVPSLVVGMLIFIVALTAIWRLKSRWAAPVVIIGGAVAGHLALG